MRYILVRRKRTLATVQKIGKECYLPPNASAAPRFIGCPLNPPFVLSGNRLPFSALSVFAGVDVLGAVVAIIKRNGGSEPNLTDAAHRTNGTFSVKVNKSTVAFGIEMMWHSADENLCILTQKSVAKRAR